MPTNEPSKRNNLIFKVGQDRFRPPPDVDEVSVLFGGEPIRTILFRRFGAKKAVLLATVISPKELHGSHVAGFYALPSNGMLPAGSRLMQDARTMLGGHAPEGELIDLHKVFAGRMARVSLRRVGKGTDIYCVIDKILKKL